MLRILPIALNMNSCSYCDRTNNNDSPIIIFGDYNNGKSTTNVLKQNSQKETLNQILYNEQLKLNIITDNYNLVNNPPNSSKALNDAILLSKTFINKYGKLASLSREELLLTKYPNMSPSKTTQSKYDCILRERKNYSKEIETANNISKLMLKYHEGDCGDCTYVLHKMSYEQFGDKYNILTLNYYATVGSKGYSHVATLLTSKDGKEEYVIDPWLNPDKGGVYKRKDWEMMMHKVFDVNINDKNNKVSIFTNDSIYKNMLQSK